MSAMSASVTFRTSFKKKKILQNVCFCGISLKKRKTTNDVSKRLADLNKEIKN
jgi:hypothetical protein